MKKKNASSALVLEAEVVHRRFAGSRDDMLDVATDYVDVDTGAVVRRVIAMARNGLQAPEVQRIIDAQASRAQRLAAADVVLFNDGIPLDDLRERVQQIGTQFGL